MNKQLPYDLNLSFCLDCGSKELMYNGLKECNDCASFNLINKIYVQEKDDKNST